MTNQEMEARLNALEQELTLLKQPKPKTENHYLAATKQVNAYFKRVMMKDQMFTAQGNCEKIAREAFMEKHHIVGREGKRPTLYIKSPDDAAEYFMLFGAFLDVWQSYVYGEEWKKKEDT